MLYIVGTPIGNLSDLSLRQAKTIAGSSVILAEDTRTTGLLLKKIEELFGFKTDPQRQLISYHKENEFEKLPSVMEMLESGKDLTLISQAGMPLISDPGALLVREAVKRGITLTVVPGPTAVTTALVQCGLPFSHYLFFGFLPKKQSDVRKALNSSKKACFDLEKCVAVYYESPSRINDTLALLNEISPDASVCVCRELTKLHEETVRGNPSELKDKSFKGELVMVVSYNR